MKAKQPAKQMKEVLDEEAKNKLEPAEESANNPEVKQAKDDHTEKPEVDQGIDYMKWSD